ncbi:VOC family protein [Flavisolibacter ginsengisoli]|jgi:glyoxalase family protein|uniref:Glyoxalase family protein n=1 Tax=Flavisolibacter ginsengisoli DSM 18119 TaxID=1121884 RepID=A0A1M5AQE7_9BACT|nr:VOC family protein [Flavisolibacter ginsengisoli]SHF32386.1 glyoxalase family protein [Flavisolibacter ginsengisoli DSM 18119]
MNQLITGIHHVTAIASNAQKNIDFYTGVLGLRLVKKTVNFDGPDVYHFYYGDETGNPGTILTFFPYQGLVNGRHGKGMLNTTSFSVPSSSINFWLDRLRRFDINYKKPQERFIGEVVIYFEDEDGLGLELVFNDIDTRRGFSTGPVPEEHAIKGLYNVEIWEEGYERTGGLLTTQLDHQLIGEKGNRFRFAAKDAPGNYVDVLCSPDSLKGLTGSGIVHHIAFATPDATTQAEVRLRMVQRMLNPTPVLDRSYFTSIYFREPGGVLFEVATSGPGFGIDETQANLGKTLKLPPQFEADREKIESALAPITVNTDKYR